MSVYVCADAQLFKNNDSENTFIQEWNKRVDFGDIVLILGEFSCGNECQTKSLISQLKGELYIIDYSDSSPSKKFSKEKWQSFGIYKVWCGGAMPIGIINGKKQGVVIAVTKDELQSKDIKYFAAAKSLTGSEKKYEKHILNLSIEHWGRVPISYKKIPQLIDNILKHSKED